LTKITNDPLNTQNRTEIQLAKNILNELNELEFEALVSKTAIELALQLEKQNSKHKSNPFAHQTDEITLSHKFDLNKILSSMDINIDKENTSSLDQKLQPEDHLKRTTKFQTMKFLNENAQLDHTTFGQKNMFVKEEINLAEQTMNRALIRKQNLEKKMTAPPLSHRDRRVRKKKRINAGKLWFNLPRGKLTTENKLHFLMVKHRHLLYRKWKPPKQFDKYIPKYFQMGRVVEGPADFYSARMPRKTRKQTWAKEFMANADTKEWLRIKTERALGRARRPGSKFWKPTNQFKQQTRYKLRKRIHKVRKLRKQGNQTNNNNNNKPKQKSSK